MCFDQEKTQAPQRPEDGISSARNQAVHAQAFEIGYKQGAAESRDTLDEYFRYHPPTPEDLPRFEAINQAAKNFAQVLRANCPFGHDFICAIDKLREARMIANASIALKGRSL